MLQIFQGSLPASIRKPFVEPSFLLSPFFGTRLADSLLDPKRSLVRQLLEKTLLAERLETKRKERKGRKERERERERQKKICKI